MKFFQYFPFPVKNALQKKYKEKCCVKFFLSVKKFIWARGGEREGEEKNFRAKNNSFSYFSKTTDVYLKPKCLWISFTHISHSHSLSSAAATTTPLLASVMITKVDVLDMKMSDDIFGRLTLWHTHHEHD